MHHSPAIAHQSVGRHSQTQSHTRQHRHTYTDVHGKARDDTCADLHVTSDQATVHRACPHHRTCPWGTGQCNSRSNFPCCWKVSSWSCQHVVQCFHEPSLTEAPRCTETIIGKMMLLQASTGERHTSGTKRKLRMPSGRNTPRLAATSSNTLDLYLAIPA